MSEIPDRPFHVGELAALGLTRYQLDAMVREGRVRRVLRGAYAPASLPDTLETRAACARLVLPDHTVVCDRSAAWLWGVDCLDPGEHDGLPRLEVVSVGGADRSRRRDLYGGQRDLLPDEVVTVAGVRVTTPLRTACDLACLRGRRSALAVLDAFARAFGLTNEDYTRMIRERYAGRRGCVQARELAPCASGLAESQGESWARSDIIASGLRAPELNPTVFIAGWGHVRPDLAYLWLKLAVEYDGEEHHSSDEDRAHDAARREAMRRQGWAVIVVTKEDFASGADGAWLDELRRVIAERVPSYTRRYSRAESWDPRRR